MTETTLIYTAEITEVVLGQAEILDKERLAAWIESKLKVDDVHIKGNVKVFEREV